MSVFVHARPSKKRRYEYLARDFFQRHFQRPFYHNRTVFCSGTAFRPDFLFVSKDRTAAVIVECDEHSHHGYNKSREIWREHKLVDALEQMGYTETTIVRFDPCTRRRFVSQMHNVTTTIKRLLSHRTPPPAPGSTVQHKRRYKKILLL